MTGPVAHGRGRRLLPVLALLILAPWVGEFLLGNISVRQLPTLLALVPLYGAGALLIREVARRTGRGWPTMLLLGAAYGVIEAGLVDQSLFNPSFESWDFLAVTPIPALGISAFNALSFVIGHAVWSIGAPIAIVELWTPARRATPWLGTPGLLATAALYLCGCYLVYRLVDLTENFLATPTQLAGAATVAAILIVLAFAIKPRRAALADRVVPRPWLLGLITFILASLHAARSETWGGVALGIALVIVATLLIRHWSRQRGWWAMHQVALVGAALLTYAWLGFVLTLLTTPGDMVRWAGNGVFALAALALLALTARAVGRERPAADARVPAGLPTGAGSAASG